MIEKLQSIGLSLTEARVYLFLLKHERAKAGEICRQLDLHTSHIYNNIDKLLKRGLISFTIVNNIKVYYPADPGILLSKFKEKEEALNAEKKQLAAFIQELKKVQVSKERVDFKYFKDVLGVRSMFVEFTDSLPQGSTVYVFSAPMTYERWNAFLLEHFHPARAKKKVLLKLLLPRSLEKYAKQRKGFPLTEIRYTEEEYPSEFGVCGEYVYFLSTSDRPYATLFRDANFSKTQQMIFEKMWNGAR